MKRKYAKRFTALLALVLAVSAPASVSAAPLQTRKDYYEQRYSSDRISNSESSFDDSGDFFESRNEYPSDDGGFIYDSPPPFDYDDPPRQYDWSSDMVADITLSSREEGLNIEGELPEISEEFGGSAGSLNDEIDNAVKKRIRAAKDARAKEISFDYDVYSDSDMVSVIVRSKVTSATSKTEFDSVNFDPFDGSLMDITDAVGFDVIPLAEKILSERIRRDPEMYNAAFDTASISENPFFMEDDEIVILFDDFQLSSAADGINELRLELGRINQVEIARQDYHINQDYNIRMVPLKQICRGLGYDVEWVEEDGRVDIYLNGELVSDLEPDVNDYEEHGRRRRSLETAPELYLETVYVPISFFDQILSWITYTVDRDDNITFYSYDD